MNKPLKKTVLAVALVSLCITLFQTMSGCGYSTTSLYPEGKTVAIPIFENRTLWREREKGLTDEVTRKVLARTPYRLTDADSADMIIRGEITRYSQPVLSEDNQDNVVRSSVQFQVDIKIIDGQTGRILEEDKKSFSAPFSGRRGQTERAARAHAEEKVARWVTQVLETESW